MIGIDRLLAIKYALRYNILVTKWRINLGCLISVSASFVILACLFFICGVESTSTHEIFYSNRETLDFLTIIRGLTCAIIIILGKLTIRLRNEIEANRPTNAADLHGREAERLDIVVKLKRSVKDITRFNILTCIFLTPLVMLHLIFVAGFKTTDQYFISRLNFVFSLIYYISNPIVYLITLSKIRQYWYRQWIRRSITSTMESTL